MLNSDEFKRIKIGVGSEELTKRELADFVLGKFTDQQLTVFSKTVDNVVDAVMYMLKNDTAKAMNLFN